MVSNLEQIQILKTFVDFGPSEEPTIVLESLCTLSTNSLPVQILDHSLENIIFNFFEVSTFFVIGKKNTTFDEEMESNASADKMLDDEILLEKFYVNNGDDLSSKTLGYLQLHGESVQKYCVS